MSNTKNTSSKGLWPFSSILWFIPEVEHLVYMESFILRNDQMIYVCPVFRIPVLKLFNQK